jgi:hypothetical protein
MHQANGDDFHVAESFCALDRGRHGRGELQLECRELRRFVIFIELVFQQLIILVELILLQQFIIFIERIL